MKPTKKIIALTLTGVLLISIPFTAFAAESPSEKEEVIYIMTDAKGDVKNIQVVNSFRGGTITDYGDYSAVKMLTTTDTIQQTKDKITFSSNADKIYYQGTMVQTDIPWNISIYYYMNGKEYSPSEIAGKTGKLEIRFSVSKNENYSGTFYDDYALQASFALNTNQCQNISAADASIANVGSDKQLTYTILPGKGIDTCILADVTDFEMDAVSMNGIQLNLNVEVDDAELMGKVHDIMDASSSLNHGAANLNDASTTLKQNTSSLNHGSSTLQNGLDELNQGIVSLQSGITSMQTGLGTLDEKSDTLTSGSKQVVTSLETLQNQLDYSQYKALMKENGLDIDTLQSGNTSAISALSAQITSLQSQLSSIEGIPGMEVQAAQLQTQIESFQTIRQLLLGNNAAIGGTETYLGGLYDGTDTLISSYSELNKGINEYTKGVGDALLGCQELSSGAASLSSAGSQLADGTNTFYTQTSDMDTQVQDQIDELMSSIQGESTETVSFASSKNTNIDSVQFVIKTASIEKADTNTQKEEKEVSLSFWQKFVNLFH